MRLLRRIGLLLALAITAAMLAAASASAVLPEFLDGTLVGLKFTGESKASKIMDIATKRVIECTKDKVSGEVTGEKTLKANIDLEGCTELKFAINSLGDAEGVVLLPVSGELCFLKEKEPLEVGMYFKIAGTVHAEDKVVEELELFSGTFIGKWEFIKKLQALQDIAFNKPNLKECGGKKAEFKLELNLDKKPLLVEIESFEELHFEKDIEVMG